jgi:hypothetical protein
LDREAWSPGPQAADTDGDVITVSWHEWFIRNFQHSKHCFFEFLFLKKSSIRKTDSISAYLILPCVGLMEQLAPVLNRKW